MVRDRRFDHSIQTSPAGLSGAVNHFGVHSHIIPMPKDKKATDRNSVAYTRSPANRSNILLRPHKPEQP